MEVGARLRRTAGLRHDLGPDGGELRVRAPTASAVSAVPGELEQGLLSLAVNACDAMPAGGTLTVSADDLRGPRREVRIRVDDTGVGMSEQVRQHALDPFFTTKSMSESAGLGLWTVYGTVTRAGGTVHIESEVDAGTCVELRLPATAPTPTPGSPPRRGGARGGPTGKEFGPGGGRRCRGGGRAKPDEGQSRA